MWCKLSRLMQHSLGACLVFEAAPILPGTCKHGRVLCCTAVQIWPLQSGEHDAAAQQLLPPVWILWGWFSLRLHGASNAIADAIQMRVRCSPMRFVADNAPHSRCKAIIPSSIQISMEDIHLVAIPSWRICTTWAVQAILHLLRAQHTSASRQASGAFANSRCHNACPAGA